MIRIKNITKFFDGSPILNNINAKINDGEVVSIVGHNGAGKTTLIKIIAGLIIQDEGVIEIDGKAITKKDLRKISLMLEGNRNFYSEFNLYQNIEYFYRLRGYEYSPLIKTRLNHYLKIFKIEKHAVKPIFKLSRGMQQKVAVILSFVLPSTIILLDEPTLGLDIFSVDEFEKLINIAKNENKIILITSHQLNVLQRLSNRLIILHNGSIIFDDSSDLFIEKYAPMKYRFTYDSDLSKKDFLKLNKLNIHYEVIKKNEVLLPYKESENLKYYLKVLDSDRIQNINRDISDLENAYKKFMFKEGD